MGLRLKFCQSPGGGSRSADSRYLNSLLQELLQAVQVAAASRVTVLRQTADCGAEFPTLEKACASTVLL